MFSYELTRNNVNAYVGHRGILIKCTDLQPTHKRIQAISIQKHNDEKLDQGEGAYNRNIFL